MSIRRHRVQISVTAQQIGWLEWLATLHGTSQGGEAYRIFSAALGEEMTKPENNAERYASYQKLVGRSRQDDDDAE